MPDAEQVVAGPGAMALSYNGKTITDSRSELGLRADKSYAMPNGILTLRDRLAWAHDFNTDRSAAAVFQALPGTFFLVNGAFTLEGQYADVYKSYAGKSVVRYAW
jgi:uncharacterized protein with beta-barrel porin domain